jgi:hypothetical protein
MGPPVHLSLVGWGCKEAHHMFLMVTVLQNADVHVQQRGWYID